MKKLVAVAVAGFASVGLTAGAYADTIIPANDVEALTNAVNAATAGQVIEVSAGTYLLTEPMTLPAKHFVVLKGATGDPKDVIFDGGDKINILTITSGAKSNLVSGITFRNCRNSIQGGYGGGMQSAGAAIRMFGHNNNVNTGTVISNCVFNGCHSDTGWGGAILMPGGTTVAGCVFTNCTSQMKGSDYSTAYGGAYGGGAIYAVAKSADVYIRDSSFVDCGCSNGVGVLNCGYYAAHARTDTDGSPSTNRFGAIVVNCGFTNNWSYGSSACLNLKVREIVNCKFKGNKAMASVNFQKKAIDGRSAIWCAEYTKNNIGLGTSQFDLALRDRTIRFLSCVFEDNVGHTRSAIFSHNKNIPLCVSNCIFRANASLCSAGSLFGTAGTVELVDSTFEGNYSLLAGTGWEYSNYGLTDFAGSAQKRVLRCSFLGNRAVGGGGCVRFNGSNSTVSDCVFASNICSRSGFPGCPVSAEGATATNTLVRNCLFACNTNTSNSTGAQIYIGVGNTNNGNLGGTNAVIESCTFVGNRSNNANWNAATAGTVYIGNSGGTSKIRNCVFYDNKSIGGASGIRNFAQGGTGEGCAKLTTYCWEDGTQVPTAADKHNIRGSNPKFRDVAHGDYVPGPGSALKGNGIFCDWMTAAVDLAGNPRSPDGKVDIGCYEHIRTGLMLFVR